MFGTDVGWRVKDGDRQTRMFLWHFYAKPLTGEVHKEQKPNQVQPCWGDKCLIWEETSGKHKSQTLNQTFASFCCEHLKSIELPNKHPDNHRTDVSLPPIAAPFPFRLFLQERSFLWLFWNSFRTWISKSHLGKWSCAVISAASLCQTCWG